jgi:hypothetical protein
MSFTQQITVIKPACSFIETNSTGVAEILSFYNKACTCPNANITYNLTELSNFDANLSALLLAVIHKLKKDHRKYIFVEVPKHMNVLFRNGFVSHLSGKGNSNQYTDDRESTIPLRSFDMTDNADEYFSSYIHKDFFGHRGLVSLTKTTKGNLCTQFVEIFNNVQIHSNTTYPMFSCGQYFPEQGMLKFTMVDLGDGFLKKIYSHTKGEVTTDTKAIEWALANTNTTKDFEVYGPGGTGLKDLKTYCEANNGSLQIASGSNMLTFVKGKIVDNRLPNAFKGALVNLVFRGLVVN